jgi:hypothetical protein
MNAELLGDNADEFVSLC